MISLPFLSTSLNTSLQELTLLQSTLRSDRDDLATKLSRQTKLDEAKTARISTIETDSIDLRSRLAIAEKALVERGSVADGALLGYKKRAQASLATANARAAAAA